MRGQIDSKPWPYLHTNKVVIHLSTSGAEKADYEHHFIFHLVSLRFFFFAISAILQMNRTLLFLLLRFSLAYIYVFHIPLRPKRRQEKVFYRRFHRHVGRFVFGFILLFYSDWRRCARFTIASNRLYKSSILLSCRRCVALAVFFSRTKMNNLFYFNGFVRCPFVRTLEKKNNSTGFFSVDVVFFVRLFASMQYYCCPGCIDNNPFEYFNDDDDNDNDCFVVIDSDLRSEKVNLGTVFELFVYLIGCRFVSPECLK